MRDHTEALFGRAKKAFGEAVSFETAFWLLPDGFLLNGDQDYEGNPRRDHRDINEVYRLTHYDEGYGYLNDFEDRGAIRIMPEGGSIELRAEPTPKQLKVIGAMIRSGAITDEIEVDKDLYALNPRLEGPFLPATAISWLRGQFEKTKEKEA